jgi:hypothetical protein
MSLKTNIDALAVRIATEFKTLRTTLGDNAALTTTNKATLVAAVNELKALIDASTSVINDAVNNTTSTYSSQKIIDLLTALEEQIKRDIIGEASGAYDTLLELQTALESDQTALAGLLTAVDNRVRFDAAQSLTEIQKQQARDNIDVYSKAEIGDVTANFVTAFEAALV